MFAAMKFRDADCFLDNGIVPGVASTGTASGSAMQLGGTAPIKRMVHILEAASGTASTSVIKMYLATSTASNGTFTSISKAAPSYSVTGGGKWYLVIDTRNEWFSDQATSALWVKVVTVVTTLALPIAVTTLGYCSGSEPASNFDSSTINLTEADLF